MEAKLKFNLDEPDDTLAYKRCTHATDMAMVLWEIEYNLKRKVEDRIDAGMLKTPQETIDCVMQLFRDEMYDSGIIISDLIR